MYVRSSFPGKVLDSSILKSSPLHSAIQKGHLVPPSNTVVHNFNIPYLVLGDSGFALENWLMKPFTYRMELTVGQTIFNKWLNDAKLKMHLGESKGIGDVR